MSLYGIFARPSPLRPTLANISGDRLYRKVYTFNEFLNALTEIASQPNNSGSSITIGAPFQITKQITIPIACAGLTVRGSARNQLSTSAFVGTVFSCQSALIFFESLGLVCDPTVNQTGFELTGGAGLPSNRQMRLSDVDISNATTYVSVVTNTVRVAIDRCRFDGAIVRGAPTSVVALSGNTCTFEMYESNVEPTNANAGVLFQTPANSGTCRVIGNRFNVSDESGFDDGFVYAGNIVEGAAAFPGMTRGSVSGNQFGGNVTANNTVKSTFSGNVFKNTNMTIGAGSSSNSVLGNSDIAIYTSTASGGNNSFVGNTSVTTITAHATDAVTSNTP